MVFSIYYNLSTYQETNSLCGKGQRYCINFFDTADVYSLGASEEVLGRALKDFARRDQVIIATKVFNVMSDAPNDRELSRKHIEV